VIRSGTVALVVLRPDDLTLKEPVVLYAYLFLLRNTTNNMVYTCLTSDILDTQNLGDKAEVSCLFCLLSRTGKLPVVTGRFCCRGCDVSTALKAGVDVG
jgi:hypothetical protein